MTALDPATPPIQLLALLGPGAPAPALDPPQAIAYCRGLATSHYENFSVLSSLVPPDLRDDFAAVYAFCRWADDLGDETGADDAARARSLDLLAWWRDQVHDLFDPTGPRARHPVFIALAQTLARRGLPRQPLLDLIDAFTQDQHVRAYQTWDEVLGYCRRSADPVGRLVLHLFGYPDVPANAERYRLSDLACSALQLINFWQDVRRDLLERDRVYIPALDTGITPAMLRDWANRPDDSDARVPYILALRPLVDRTAAMFDQAAALPALLDPRARPVVGLFIGGGASVLAAVRRAGCATLWRRPTLTPVRKATLLARAWIRARAGGIQRR
jgi:squalene synthase HpnC